MFRYLPIRRVYGREVLDSRGNPTVEVEVTVGEGIMGLDGYTGCAMVPSGASTGKHEALELRDGGKRYQGKGVQKVVTHINTRISELLAGENALDQMKIDHLLILEDGTKDKSHFGANAVLGVSMAVAQAAAMALHIPLYQYLGGIYTPKLPVPMMNILNGGRHADNQLDFQEFMIMPLKADSFCDGLSIGTEIYHCLKDLLKKEGLSTSVGDEGGFAPTMTSAEEVFCYLMKAVECAGFKPGEDVGFAMDAAASELYDEKKKVYKFAGEGASGKKEIARDSEEMIALYQKLSETFPLVSIEDGLAEDDWKGWQKLTETLGNRVQLVGDDLFVTNVMRLQKGIHSQVANAVLIKPNQIGTVSETLQCIEAAQKAGYRAIISHRSGETEDSFIADLAVASGAGQIKTGAPCRSERNAKYNQILRIEEHLGEIGKYENPFRCAEK